MRDTEAELFCPTVSEGLEIDLCADAALPILDVVDLPPVSDGLEIDADGAVRDGAFRLLEGPDVLDFCVADGLLADVAVRETEPAFPPAEPAGDVRACP